MKFGHEYSTALANDGFPPEWVEKAIEYKHLKKCIKKIHNELEDLGLDEQTLGVLGDLIAQPRQPQKEDGGGGGGHEREEFYSAAKPGLDSIPEEFTPQLRILVDRRTGTPLDARLAPETRKSLRKLARHEIVVAGRREHLGGREGLKGQNTSASTAAVAAAAAASSSSAAAAAASSSSTAAAAASSAASSSSSSIRGEEKEVSSQDRGVNGEEGEDARWVQVPLASANDFFQLLEPKLVELESLRDAETHKLEEAILDLGDAVENVIQPVRDGFETRRQVSYRDLYFWREMFRLYLEKPIFYSETERKRGALTFAEAKRNLEDYDQQLRTTGLLDKMKTPQAKLAAKQFLDLNVRILSIMHFQEWNSRAMTKILKKFNKRTHLQGQEFIKSLRGSSGILTLKSSSPFSFSSSSSSSSPSPTPAGTFADSIARDLHAEIGSKVLSIVPQLDDWICPICYGMAWRPVNLGCCRAVFCIRCIIHLQDQRVGKCPMCNSPEAVTRADGRNLDVKTMEFLQKFFPMEVKKRQRENERAALVREQGEGFVRKGCVLM